MCVLHTVDSSIYVQMMFIFLFSSRHVITYKAERVEVSDLVFKVTIFSYNLVNVTCKLWLCGKYYSKYAC